MLSVEEVIESVPGVEPAGRDLSLSGELLEVEAMARPVSSTNSDGKRVADDFNEREPDWAALETRSASLLRESRDLRIATFYTAALLRTNGLQGLARGLKIVGTLLTAGNYKAHPQYDVNDRSTLLERWYTLVTLAAPYKQEGDLHRIVEGVRNVSLIRSKSIPCHYKAVVAARNQSGGPDVAALERIRSEWKRIPDGERREAEDSLSTALEATATIETILLEQTPEHAIPSGGGLRPLYGLTQELKGVREFLTGSVSQPKQAAVAQEKNMTQEQFSGEIKTRADAIRALQHVADFFRRTEPSSPIPYFIERAVRMVDRDFMALLGDLVPDAVQRFQSLAGVEGQESSQR